MNNNDWEPWEDFMFVLKALLVLAGIAVLVTVFWK
jgi:hypothetical protein